ncbi:NRDE family protein [Halobacterium zhouii]|uniref:NRDE family protein n=1 Tax=Halobacterium zhouii TaxID=2902624 RepID=UPI001E2C6E0A|nr:NRDE family protein [Halobacterium zhouii]
MCTLAFAWRVYDDAPLVVAANRDEAVGRPASPPAVHGESPQVLMPRDEEAGGTWIGVNEHRVFVAVTNRRVELEDDDSQERPFAQSEERGSSRRSRGLLVTDALDAESASDAVEVVRRELADREYAGFNLVVADDEDCVLLEWDGVLRRHDLESGTHVVVNEGYDDGTEKSRTIRRALGGTTQDEWVTAAREALSDHETGACVHGDGFGTRSSSLVTIDDGGESGPDSGSVRYDFADGPPCETPYRRVDNQL